MKDRISVCVLFASEYSALSHLRAEELGGHTCMGAGQWLYVVAVGSNLTR